MILRVVTRTRQVKESKNRSTEVREAHECECAAAMMGTGGPCSWSIQFLQQTSRRSGRTRFPLWSINGPC